MTLLEALQQRLCDRLHQPALEKNRFLLQHRRTPEAPAPGPAASPGMLQKIYSRHQP